MLAGCYLLLSRLCWHWCAVGSGVVAAGAVVFVAAVAAVAAVGVRAGSCCRSRCRCC